MPSNPALPIWQQPEIIRWCQIMARSYQKLLGRSLGNFSGSPTALAQMLYHAPYAVVSHGTEANPVFNYGNQTALDLWSLTWEEFTQTPSAESAEPMERGVRRKFLQQAVEQGFVQNFEGIRISRTGQRFLIKGVTLWNLADEAGQYCGQAATYARWEWL